MSFHARTFFDFFALSAVLAIAFAVIGAPIKIALRVAGCSAARVVPAPFLGMSVVMVVSWYWGGPFGGTKPLVQALLAGSSGLLLLIAAAAFARPSWRCAVLAQSHCAAATRCDVSQQGPAGRIRTDVPGYH